MYDTTTELLIKLKRAKALVQELEFEYREKCECNDLLDGTRKKDFNYNDKVLSYNTMKTHKTCAHHQVKIHRK